MSDNEGSSVSFSSDSLRPANRDPREQGTIIIVLAMLLLVIVGFLALALEIPAIGGTQRKQYETAQLGALAFLSTYETAAVTPSATQADQHRERMIAAMSRLAQVVGFRSNDLQFGGLGRQTIPSANELKDMSGVVTTNATNIRGEVTPGDWFFEEPNEGCAAYSDPSLSCPCPSGIWKGECFKPATPTQTTISAVQVALNTRSSSPINLVFGKLLGSVPETIWARARASVKPRVFLTGVDLSRSVAFDTHIPWDLTTGAGSNLNSASEYVFPLDDSAAGSSCSGHSNPCLASFTPSNFPTGCQFRTNDFFHMVWYTMDAVRDPSKLYPKTKHFRSDYTCWVVNGRHYLIDTSIHDYGHFNGVSYVRDGSYFGPEPLVTILGSFREAMNEMERRSVSGDRIVLYGFDQDADVSGPRFVGPTNPHDTSLWNDLRDITNVRAVQDMPGAIAEDPLLKKRILDHQLFPRPPDSFTDLAGAIFGAQQLVSNISYSETANVQLTLFTDGFANVRHDPYMAQDGAGNTVMGADVFTNASCGPADRVRVWYDGCWRVHDEAVADAILMVTNESKFWGRSPWWYGWKEVYPDGFGFRYLAKRGFKINVGLFGSDAQPHFLLKKSKTNPSKCMDDLDARKNYSSTLGNDMMGDWRNPFALDGPFWTNDASQGCYITLGAPDACKYPLIAMTLWRGLVVPTGGRFLPVRTPCDVSAVNAQFPSWALTEPSCKAGALESKMNSELCAPYTGFDGDGDPYVNNWGEEYTINRYLDPPLGDRVQGLINAGVLTNTMQFLDQSKDPPEVREHDDDDNDGDGWRGNVFNTRSICDTRCRSPEDQIRGLYQDLFATNPYVIVRDDN